MKFKGGIWSGVLAGVIALAAPSLAFASTMSASVNYAEYLMDGTPLDSGVVAPSPGGTGLNNTSVTDSSHAAIRMVHFWIDPIAGMTDVSWTFDWSLAYGGTISPTSSSATVRILMVDTSIAIATDHAGYSELSGTSIIGDDLFYSLPKRVTIGKGQTLSLAANQKSDSYTWDGGDQLSVWAYVSNSVLQSTSGNLQENFTNFGNVLASTTVTVADPVLPDLLPLRDGGGGGGAAVPEPGSLALLCGAGVMGLIRRRRDRLRPSAVPTV